MKKINDYVATVAGLIVAIAQAWMNVDWKDFHFEKQWPELALSAAIAAGGYFSVMKSFGKKVASNEQDCKF